MKLEDLIDALDGITWYNGIYEPLLKLKEDLINQKTDDNYLRKDNFLKGKHKGFDDDQFEIFWMMLVLLYGDYGTSPRSGWLEMKNKEKIIEFIDKITITGVEADEWN